MRALALALLAASGCAATRAYYASPLPPEAEVVLAHTADGYLLPVIHYLPTGPRQAAPPIVLCHGISANARHMDLDAAHSLARWLAARGFETWSMSLRGTLDALLPAGSPEPEGLATTLDTYAQADLPAVIALVRERDRVAQVDFVGHSMGGLVLYDYLARGGGGIRAAVTLGSPALLRPGGALERVIREDGAMVLTPVSRVHDFSLSGLYAPIAGDVDTPLERLVMNPQNVTLATWRTLLAVGTADIAGGVLRQFQRGIADERFESADGAIDLLQKLHAVKTPVLVVAGKADSIAPAGAVKAAYRALGGEKRFFIAGVESGARADYGHVDLIVGERAPREVWPEISRWLARFPALDAKPGAVSHVP